MSGRGSPQTQQRWSCQGRRPGSCAPTRSGEASSCPTGFSRCFHHLASAHTETRNRDAISSLSSAKTNKQKNKKRGKTFRYRTDPFADLSVDEDQVVQCQNYFCGSASPTSEAEAYPSASPGQSDKRKQVSRLSCVSLSHMHASFMDLLESEEEVSSDSSQCNQKKQKKQQRD